jgi:hypothetical protein
VRPAPRPGRRRHGPARPSAGEASGTAWLRRLRPAPPQAP